ncbi:MAG: 7-carboxy-7-deazaguanine synthase QueE [Elusimicrobia bacterium]|nr:7-carboxy-7-deazaguanine synthase QueE [Elusimicrobiota bacterium]
MKKGKISEIFFSIQGEGVFAGTPSYFVRFYGCNKRCFYCDTFYALKGKFYTSSVDEVVEKIPKGQNVVITGGEPTCQIEFLKDLTKKLKKRRNFISIETNGFKSLKGVDFDFVSFHIEKLGKKEKKFIREISKKLFCIKVVVTKKTTFSDVKKVAEFLKDFKKATLILQVQSRGNQILKNSVKKAFSFAREISDFYSSVRVLPQIHKILKLK